jgi:Gpi18-like mannosyltransferase
LARRFRPNAQAVLTKARNGWTKIPWVDTAIVIIGIILAFFLRLSLRGIASGDYYSSTLKWYTDIREYGIAAINGAYSNYTPAYIYLLYLSSAIFHNLAAITIIKLPSILCDFVLAWFVGKIVQSRYTGLAPLLAFFAVLFAPTVVLNSAAWGQADSIYTMSLLACLYFILKGKGWLACLAFGISFSFKLQAVFLLPFLFVLTLRRKIQWYQLLVIPAVYFLSIIPAWIAGRQLTSLLSIYLAQSNLYQNLTMNAPTMFAWFSNDFEKKIFLASLFFAAGIIFLYIVLGYKSKVQLTAPTLVQLALISALIVPFFLPRMHERYFYPADVLSIVYGFFFPQYFFVPLVVNLSSFFTYETFLFTTGTIIPLPVLAIFLLAVIVIIVRHLILTSYPAADGQEKDTNV